MASPPSANGNRPAPSATSAAKPSPGLRLIIKDFHFEAPPYTPFTVVGWTGTEGISQLFHHELELVADPATAIDFHRVLGQLAILEIALGERKRRIHGIIGRLTQERTDRAHAHFRAEITSRLWLTTKIAQSRVFQDLDAVDIIKAVFDSWPTPRPMVDYRIQGRYPKRPYCVQYRETDFQFLSRLMEEEGIYYFFDHEDDLNERLVISDTPLGHPDLPEGYPVHLEYADGGNRKEDRVTDWRKTQEMRAGKYTLWDHSFELPPQHLQATKSPLPSVRVGSTSHRLELQWGANHEIYDYPGGYAQHFDSVNRGGGNQAANLQGVFEDNQRTAAIRMEQETVPCLVIRGAGTYRHFRAGYAFTLEAPDRFHISKERAEGRYLLTSVTHRATQSADRSGDRPGFRYENQFTCIPVDLPFRPLRLTRKPVIHGTQTAVVVGSGADGEEIFTDKYGRVKVRFFWDRRDPADQPDSCWVRVAQPCAGKRWGASFWPRIGQEVVLAFEEGDPDKPIIIGSVYNAEQMPPYLGDGLDSSHRNDPKVSGIKTCTTPEGKGFNEIRFDDTKGKEQVFIRSQNALDVRALGSQRTSVGGDCHLTVGGEAREKVASHKILEVGKELQVWVEGLTYLESLKSVYIKAVEQTGIVGEEVIVKAGSRLTVVCDNMLELRSGKSRIVITPEVIFLKAPEVQINSGDFPTLPIQAPPFKPYSGTKPADDSQPGFVSNPYPAKKKSPEPGASGAAGEEAGG
jgi:type VI secretion system secreted protein VgrG